MVRILDFDDGEGNVVVVVVGQLIGRRIEEGYFGGLRGGGCGGGQDSEAGGTHVYQKGKRMNREDLETMVGLQVV